MQNVNQLINDLRICLVGGCSLSCGRFRIGNCKKRLFADIETALRAQQLKKESYKCSKYSPVCLCSSCKKVDINNDKICHDYCGWSTDCPLTDCPDYEPEEESKNES